MQMTRTPNMVLINIIQTKGRDTIPLRSESFGRIGIGPQRKNLVIPKELVIKLMTNVIKGRAWLMSLNEVAVYPEGLIGKNPSTAKVMANETWTLNKIL